MRTLLIPWTTGDYIKIPVTKWDASIADPTSLTVEMAIVTSGGNPASGDYRTAAWVIENGVYKARLLWTTAVPSPAQNADYAAWLRITASPQIPVIGPAPIRTY